jgi:hypothetical protein
MPSKEGTPQQTEEWCSLKAGHNGSPAEHSSAKWEPCDDMEEGIIVSTISWSLFIQMHLATSWAGMTIGVILMWGKSQSHHVPFA